MDCRLRSTLAKSSPAVKTLPIVRLIRKFARGCGRILYMPAMSWGPLSTRKLTFMHWLTKILLMRAKRDLFLWMRSEA